MPPATYRVPLYPLTPIVFAASSGAMVWAAVRYAILGLTLVAVFEPR